MTPNYAVDYAVEMKEVTALELRQSLGKVLELLERDGEPVLLHKRGRPVAAIISLRDFRERFAERAAAEERDRLIEQMDELAGPSVDPTPVVDILRELRGN